MLSFNFHLTINNPQIQQDKKARELNIFKTREKITLKKSPDFFRRKSKLFPQKVRTFLRKCLNFFHRYFSPPQTQVISPLKHNDNQTHERFLTISDLDLKQNPYIWQHFRLIKKLLLPNDTAAASPYSGFTKSPTQKELRYRITTRRTVYQNKISPKIDNPKSDCYFCENKKKKLRMTK